MSDRLDRAEKLMELAQSTSSPEWAAAHSLTALALLVREVLSGRS
jgi:hypothetical protein